MQRGGIDVSGGDITTRDFQQAVPGSQGDHLNGSYPSDASGNPVSDGTTTASSWTAFSHTGGVDSPNTFTDVWALCVNTTSTPTPTPVVTPMPTPSPGVTATMTRLTVIPNPAFDFFPVILIADVHPHDAAGMVQFRDGTNTVGGPAPVVGGSALTLAFGLTPGEHTITAVFIPADPQRFGPSSDPEQLRVLSLFRWVLPMFPRGIGS